MNYTKEVFRILNGDFISANDPDERMSLIYKDIDNHFDEYNDYFSQEGLMIERGNGYFYFVNTEENNTRIKAKLESAVDLLDPLYLLREVYQDIMPNDKIRKTALTAGINNNPLLKQQLLKRFSGEKSIEDMVQKGVIDPLEKSGYIQLTDEISGEYKVMNAYDYLVQMANIMTESEYYYEDSVKDNDDEDIK